MSNLQTMLRSILFRTKQIAWLSWLSLLTVNSGCRTPPTSSLSSEYSSAKSRYLESHVSTQNRFIGTVFNLLQINDCILNLNRSEESLEPPLEWEVFEEMANQCFAQDPLCLTSAASPQNIVIMREAWFTRTDGINRELNEQKLPSPSQVTLARAVRYGLTNLLERLYCTDPSRFAKETVSMPITAWAYRFRYVKCLRSLHPGASIFVSDVMASVMWLKKHGLLDSQTTDGAGNTILHNAVLTGNYRLVQMACRSLSCSSIDLTNKKGYTALMISCDPSNLETSPFIVSSLLNCGANPNFQNPITGETALHIACGKRNPLVADLVLNDDFPDVVRLLMNHGADPMLQDKNGWTCFDHAERNGVLGSLLQ